MAQHLSVLMIFDSEPDVHVLRQKLESGGYDLDWTRVTKSSEFVAALDRQPWDLILCDYQLVRFSALAALALLQERESPIPMIVFSDTSGENFAVAAMRFGARDYMLKNDLARLVPAVARELRSVAAQRVQKDRDSELRYVLGHAECLLWSGTVIDYLDPSGLMNWQTQVFDEEAARRFAPIACLPDEPFTSAWYRQRLDEDRRRTDAASTKALRGGSSSYTQTFGCRMRDGSVRWFSEQVHITSLSAISWRVVGVAVDITQRQLVQNALRDETMRVTALNQIGLRISAELDLQLLAQAVIMAVVQVTEAQIGVFAYSAADDRGDYQTMYALEGAGSAAFARHMADDQRACIETWLQERQALRTNDARAPDCVMSAAGEPVWQSMLAVPVILRGTRTPGIVMLAHTQANAFSARAEQLALGLAAQTAIAMDNAYLYREAQAAIRIRETFLSIAAHELRTPLTTMLGYAQFMHDRAVRDPATTDQERRALTAILHQGQRLNQLVTSLLDRSQLQSGRLQIERHPVLLSALVQRIVSDMALTLRQHTIRLECAEDIYVQGDESRLEQVVYNLMTNALKYSVNGGEIIVRVARTAEEAIIAVSDFGIGIPANEQEQLFTQFYRATNVDPRRISGLGIGLFLVGEIVAQYDGRVEVVSVENQGSTFTVYLPLLT